MRPLCEIYRNLAFENFGKAFEADPEYENGWYQFYRYAELAYRFKVTLSRNQRLPGISIS